MTSPVGSLVVGAAAVASLWWCRHRASPAVRGWRSPHGDLVGAGPLQVRTDGDGQDAGAVVLLHGITSSHLQWGGAYDVLSQGHRVVVPDLLGFGQSMHADGPYTLNAHLDALDAMATALELDGTDIVVAGHSMGALLALHWAARRSDVTRVVGFCAPLYRSAKEADDHITAMGVLERLFALNGPLAKATCALMCRYRRTAQWVSVAISPQWPVPMARAGVLHNWDSYLGGMDTIIRAGGWVDAIAELDARMVPVVLADGARDPVPVAGLAEDIAARHSMVETQRHPDAGHDLPLTHPHWCLRLLDTRATTQAVFLGTSIG